MTSYLQVFKVVSNLRAGSKIPNLMRIANPFLKHRGLLPLEEKYYPMY